ncbi:lysophospholipid acyltransferase family protein [Leptobacterium sp. I13]|uniref:lysophospholipid acyltransferase family protein n=1 Tax=Leptobacterium meishanense TaxID=3128904 RepID=UPI0030EEAE2E
MQLLIYILAYPLLWLTSCLPFKILYFISDVVYVIVYRVIGYRRKVVKSNLKLVFPDKSTLEIKKIEKKFYKHMCDMFLEMIKTMNISAEEMKKRFTFTNVEALLQLEKKNDIILLFPHYASWEWVIALNQYIDSKGYAIYQRITNKYFDRLVRNIREKFGTTLIETKETKQIIDDNKRNGIRSMYGILSDQSPRLKQAIYWKEFMGIKVPVHVGSELIAKRTGLSVVYFKVRKTRRGFYQGTFKILAKNPEEYPDFEITDLFLEEVENQIKAQPEYYFWTHKRWKHCNKLPEELKS